MVSSGLQTVDTTSTYDVDDVGVGWAIMASTGAIYGQKIGGGGGG
jgi:hypothetical protein